MKKTLTVALPGREYQIEIQRGLLDQAGERCRALLPRARKLAVVTDSNVLPLYLERTADSLKRAGFQVLCCSVPAGEAAKCPEQLVLLWEKMMSFGMTRTDGVAALGGGVVGDLAGFAAATLLRGVDFIQIPTTLLAQVDSSVGGKVAIDLQAGKNLAGAFWQPKGVLIDPDCLNTLSDRAFSDGMAEVIKYGCIADEELLTRLEQQEPDWPRIIRRCLACKAALVAQDERDEGPRRLLNFGHTFGHAMEALGGGRYTHGECVAAGMMEMLRWQTDHGSDQTAMLARLGTLLERYDLPRRLDLPETAWRQYLLRDKKRSGGEMTIAVLERPGHGVLWSVTPEELLEETRWM